MKVGVFLRTEHNYDRDAARVALRCCKEEDRCDPQFKDDADINVILKRFGVTGQLPTVVKMPMSGDFTGVSDFQTAMNLVRAAKEEFNRLPADLRRRFGEDPQKLIAFLENDKNREEAMRLGLLEKPVEKTRDAVAAIDELAAKLVPRETK